MSISSGLLRKFRPRRDSKVSPAQQGPDDLDTTRSLSDELAAVLLEDRLSRSPTGLTTEDAAPNSELPPPAKEAAITAEKIAPQQRHLSEGRRCTAASEALKAAELGLSPRELRQQRAAAAALAAAEAPVVSTDERR